MIDQAKRDPLKDEQTLRRTKNGGNMSYWPYDLEDFKIYVCYKAD